MNENGTLKLAESAGQVPEDAKPREVKMPFREDRLWNVQFRVHLGGEDQPRPSQTALVQAETFEDARDRLYGMCDVCSEYYIAGIADVVIESIVYTAHSPIFTNAPHVLT